MLALAWFGLGLGLFAAPASAPVSSQGSAAEAKTIFMLPLIPLTPLHPGEAETMNLKTINALRLGGFRVRTDEVASPPAPVGPALPSLAEIEALERAGQTEAAAKLAKALLEALSTSDDPGTDLRPLPRLYLLLARQGQRDGQPKQVKQAVARAAFLHPELSIEEPWLKAAYEAELTQLLKRPRASLKVTGPAGAFVEVDGRGMGRAPLQIEGLFEGVHTVTVRLPAKAWQSRMLLSAGQAAELGFELSRLEDRLALNLVTEAELTELRARAEAEGARLVLFGGALRQGGRLGAQFLVYDLDSGRIGRFGPLPWSEPELQRLDRLPKLIQTGFPGVEVRRRPFQLSLALFTPRLSALRVFFALPPPEARKQDLGILADAPVRLPEPLPARLDRAPPWWLWAIAGAAVSTAAVASYLWLAPKGPGEARYQVRW